MCVSHTSARGRSGPVVTIDHMTVPSGSFGWQADGRPPDRRVQVTGPARLTGTRNALHFEETATRPPPPTGLSASAPRRPGTARHPVRGPSALCRVRPLPSSWEEDEGGTGRRSAGGES
ncbi:hypothetical protein GCM10009536_07120 [Streptomyces thermocarboxydus]